MSSPALPIQKPSSSAPRNKLLLSKRGLLEVHQKFSKALVMACEELNLVGVCTLGNMTFQEGQSFRCGLSFDGLSTELAISSNQPSPPSPEQIIWASQCRRFGLEVSDWGVLYRDAQNVEFSFFSIVPSNHKLPIVVRRRSDQKCFKMSMAQALFRKKHYFPKDTGASEPAPTSQAVSTASPHPCKVCHQEIRNWFRGCEVHATCVDLSKITFE